MFLYPPRRDQNFIEDIKQDSYDGGSGEEDVLAAEEMVNVEGAAFGSRFFVHFLAHTALYFLTKHNYYSKFMSFHSPLILAEETKMGSDSSSLPAAFLQSSDYLALPAADPCPGDYVFFPVNSGMKLGKIKCTHAPDFKTATVLLPGGQQEVRHNLSDIKAASDVYRAYFHFKGIPCKRVQVASVDPENNTVKLRICRGGAPKFLYN